MKTAPPETGRESEVTALVDTFLGQQAPNTRLAYARALKDFALATTTHDNVGSAIAILFQQSVTGAHLAVAAYRDRMQKHRRLSARTINLRLSVLRQTAKFAYRKGLVGWILAVESVPEGSGAALVADPEVIRSSIRVAQGVDSIAGRRDFALLVLMTDIAQKRGWLCALTLRDLRVSDAGMCLRTRSVEVQLPPRTRTAVQRWLDVHPRGKNPAAPLFVNLIPGQNYALSPTAMYSIVRRLAPAGNLNPSRLRQAAIVNVVRKAAELGVPVAAVKGFTGLADSRFALRYGDASIWHKAALACANEYSDRGIVL